MISTIYYSSVYPVLYSGRVTEGCWHLKTPQATQFITYFPNWRYFSWKPVATFGRWAAPVLEGGSRSTWPNAVCSPNNSGRHLRSPVTFERSRGPCTSGCSGRRFVPPKTTQNLSSLICAKIIRSLRNLSWRPFGDSCGWGTDRSPWGRNRRPCVTSQRRFRLLPSRTSSFCCPLRPASSSAPPVCRCWLRRGLEKFSTVKLTIWLIYVNGCCGNIYHHVGDRFEERPCFVVGRIFTNKFFSLSFEYHMFQPVDISSSDQLFQMGRSDLQNCWK